MSSYETSPAKTSTFFDDGNVVSQYGMGYAPFTSVELPMQQAYPESNLNVNLTDEYNFLYQL